MAELKKLNLNPEQSGIAAVEKFGETVAQAGNVVAEKVQTVATTSSKEARANPQKYMMLGLAIVLGIASGYGLFKLLPANPATSGVDVATGQVTGGIKVGDVVGNQDEATFRDRAEGVIEKGTATGEGSHSLLRPGGPSKTANLTSSVIDLDQFVGHRVEVWGETFSAQKSGWLMDVGRIKVLELNAPKPE